MVRLKEVSRNSPSPTSLGFHSKMVRLKVLYLLRTVERHPKFPFQNGSIKRVADAYSQYLKDMFPSQNGSIKRLGFADHIYFPSQFPFQNGSIKRTYFLTIFNCYRSFHSKLVRLKVKRGFAVYAEHKGFHSKLVRLKERPEKQRKSSGWQVSIPNWFD